MTITGTIDNTLSLYKAVTYILMDNIIDHSRTKWPRTIQRVALTTRWHWMPHQHISLPIQALCLICTAAFVYVPLVSQQPFCLSAYHTCDSYLRCSQPGSIQTHALVNWSVNMRGVLQDASTVSDQWGACAHSVLLHSPSTGTVILSSSSFTWITVETLSGWLNQGSSEVIYLANDVLFWLYTQNGCFRIYYNSCLAANSVPKEKDKCGVQATVAWFWKKKKENNSL